MTYQGDPIAEKLDKLVERSGIPALQRRLESDGSRPFRVLPALSLTLAVAGLGAQIAWGGLAGFWIVWMSWMGTFALRPFGPIGQARGRQLDEREAAVLKHGHFVGLMWAFGVAVLGSLAIALGEMGAVIRLWTLWAPETGMDWLTVTFFLLAIETNVAVLAASAATPEPLEDEVE